MLWHRRGPWSCGALRRDRELRRTPLRDPPAGSGRADLGPAKRESRRQPLGAGPINRLGVPAKQVTGFVWGADFRGDIFRAASCGPAGSLWVPGRWIEWGAIVGWFAGQPFSKHSSRGGCGEIASGRLDLLLATLNKPVYKARWRQANKSNPLA